MRRLGETKATLRRRRLGQHRPELAGLGEHRWGRRDGPLWLTSLASFSYSSISFSFSWFTASTLQILLAAVSACGWGEAEWLPQTSLTQPPPVEPVTLGLCKWEKGGGEHIFQGGEGASRPEGSALELPKDCVCAAGMVALPPTGLASPNVGMLPGLGPWVHNPSPAQRQRRRGRSRKRRS